MAPSPRKPSLVSLMAKKLDGFSEGKAMQLIGAIIDQGGDEASVAALDHASGLLDQYLARNVTTRHACRAHYFRANIWSAKRHISSDWQAWLWKSKAIDGEILELRRALAHPGFEELEQRERAQIYTNLGNILNHTGRFIEAIEYWDRALIAVPKFAMACGNRGVGLGHYAQSLYDLRNHMEHKFVTVHDWLMRAISPQFAEPRTAGIFDLPVTDLIAKTLRQLKLARATITYLSLGIHAEERRRAQEKGSNALSMPMLLDTWDDDWKRQD